MKFARILVFTFLLFFLAVPAFAESMSNSLLEENNFTKAEPLIAPLNPEFIEYQEKLKQYENPDLFLVDSPENQNESIKSLYFKNGVIPSPVDNSHIDKTEISITNNTNLFLSDSPVLQSSYDLRDEGRVTPVKDQGTAGSCWTFASYASLESCTISNGVYDFSENNMKNRLSYNYSDGFDRASDEGGNSLMALAYLARWTGPVYESDDPYNDTSIYSDVNLPERKHVQEAIFLPDRYEGDPHDNEVLKRALMEYGAIYTSIEVNWQCFNEYYSTYYIGNCGGEGGHAIALVGWDDNFSKSNFSITPPGDGAFIAKNSWGTGYGDNGYFYISYYDPYIGRYGINSVFMNAEDADNYDNIYQYDPFGYVTAYGYGGDTTWAANVFMANSNEYLKAVSFYTTDEMTEYELYIYRSLDREPLDSGGPVYSSSGTFEYAGYHTVDIDSSIPLESGQDYSIVIKFTDPDYSYLAAVEKPLGSHSSSKATANPGESYLSSDGGSWMDFSDICENTSICIKAFTNTPSPKAFIDTYIPESPFEGDSIVFAGHGSDPDGLITACEWVSSLDGKLSDVDTFSIDNLSPGTHAISFRVKDDANVWSEPVSTTFSIENKPPLAEILSICPDPCSEGSLLSFSGSGTDAQGSVTAYNWTSDIDGLLSTDASFQSSRLSFGEHTVYFSVKDDEGVWSEPVSSSVSVIDDTIPEVNIYAASRELIGINRPVSLFLSSSDAHPGSTEVLIQDSSGAYVMNETITDRVANGANCKYIWNATDSSGQGVPSGEYLLTLSSTDTSGNSAYVTLSVTVDNDKPDVHICAVPVEHISINNPVTIVLNSGDANPGSTLFVIRDASNNEILNETVTVQLANGANYEFSWDASDLSDEPVPSGEYRLFVSSIDALYNRASINVSVDVDNDKPVVNIESLEGTGSTGLDVYTNSTLKVKASASGTPGNAEEAIFTLSSDFTCFKRVLNAELIDGNWTATFDLSSFPDDGKYFVTATAKDAAGNINSTMLPAVSVLDRNSPGLSARVTKFNDTHGRIKISSSETLGQNPDVKVNGKPVAVEPVMVEPDHRNWYGFIPLDCEVYTIDMSGTDLAGNRGEGSLKALLRTIRTLEGNASLFNENTGTSIIFNTTKDIEDFVILTESSAPMVNVSQGSIGFYFINIEPGTFLNENLSYATIAIPVNETDLPSDIKVEDVSIRYYNSPEDTWEILDTEIREINGINCWVTQVVHFSTFAAIADDSVAPVLESVTPVNGAGFARGTTSVNVGFDYADVQTGINASSIKFSFDGKEVSSGDNLELTGSYLCYTATGLSAGTHKASVTVFDNAGNPATFSTSFSIASSSGSSGGSGGSSSSSGGGGGGGSPEPQSNVEVKELSQQFIANGTHVEFQFPQGVTCLEFVGFDAKRTLGKTTTIVEMLKGKSELVSELPAGAVYKNLNIWVGNGVATPENIENGVIGFKVEKAWLEEKGSDLESVSIWRYNEGNWSELDTSQVSEDEICVYFEAKTPGFSPFSIIADGVAVSGSGSEVSDIVPLKGDSDASVNTSSDVEMPRAEEKPESTPGFGFMLALGVVTALFCVFKKRE